MPEFDGPEGLIYNTEPIADPEGFASEAGAASWLYLCGEEFASMEGGMSYAQVKEALARLHPEDRAAYYEVKDPVCDIIIEAAERWAAETGYVPGPSDR